MAWLCVDKDISEYIFDEKPVRNHHLDIWVKPHFRNETSWISLVENKNVLFQVKSGTVKKLLKRTLTWDDEPVEFDYTFANK